MRTTAAELSVIESIFKLGGSAPSTITNNLRDIILDSI